MRQGTIREDILTERAADPGAPKIERGHRPRYLLSGFLTCGCCGSGYIMISDSRLGCAAAQGFLIAEPMPGEKVTGLRSLEDGFTPEVMDTELLAGRILVNSRDSIIGARALARATGILAGPSTGATLAVALRVARDAEPNSNIVFIACDAGWKYFSAGLGDGNLDEMEDALEGDVFWW